MCMTPNIPTPEAPIVPESVKRVAKDQRRVVADNNAAASTAASATNPAGSGTQLPASTQKKSLLGA